MLPAVSFLQYYQLHCLVVLEFNVQFLQFHNLQHFIFYFFLIPFLIKFINFNAVKGLFVCLLACFFSFLFSNCKCIYHTFSPSDTHLALECSSTPSILLLVTAISLTFKPVFLSLLLFSCCLYFLS